MNKKEKPDEQKRGFQGIWIPAEIWLCEDLTANEKVLLAEIKSLDNKDGCFASNPYFAKFLHLTTSQVSRIIQKLKKCGIVYQEAFTGRFRVLRINQKAMSALASMLKQTTHPCVSRLRIDVKHILKSIEKSKKKKEKKGKTGNSFSKLLKQGKGKKDLAGEEQGRQAFFDVLKPISGKARGMA